MIEPNSSHYWIVHSISPLTLNANQAFSIWTNSLKFVNAISVRWCQPTFFQASTLYESWSFCSNIPKGQNSWSVKIQHPNVLAINKTTSQVRPLPISMLTAYLTAFPDQLTGLTALSVQLAQLTQHAVKPRPSEVEKKEVVFLVAGQKFWWKEVQK